MYYILHFRQLVVNTQCDVQVVDVVALVLDLIRSTCSSSDTAVDITELLDLSVVWAVLFGEVAEMSWGTTLYCWKCCQQT